MLTFDKNQNWGNTGLYTPPPELLEAARAAQQGIGAHSLPPEFSHIALAAQQRMLTPNITPEQFQAGQMAQQSMLPTNITPEQLQMAQQARQGMMNTFKPADKFIPASNVNVPTNTPNMPIMDDRRMQQMNRLMNRQEAGETLDPRKQRRLNYLQNRSAGINSASMQGGLQKSIGGRKSRRGGILNSKPNRR
jgi:hypothetical protein